MILGINLAYFTTIPIATHFTISGILFMNPLMTRYGNKSYKNKN